MSAKQRGPKKPPREMTDDEAAERLFGKRVIRKVRKELDDPKEPEKPAREKKNSTTGGE